MQAKDILIIVIFFVVWIMEVSQINSPGQYKYIDIYLQHFCPLVVNEELKQRYTLLTPDNNR